MRQNSFYLFRIMLGFLAVLSEERIFFFALIWNQRIESIPVLKVANKESFKFLTKFIHNSVVTHSAV